MSLEMITWAMKQDVKNSQFQVLIAIANEADSDGVCFTGQAKLAYKANVTDRTLRTCVAQFREMGLLHTERRTMTFGRGRKTDAIVLHPEITDYEKAPYPHEDQDRKKAARNRKKYEVKPAKTINENQPENFSGRTELPSQTQPENFSGRTTNRKAQVFQPESSGVSTGKIQQTAFNRNARAFNPFIDPINPSIDSSLSSTELEDSSSIDEPIEKTEQAKFTEDSFYKGFNIPEGSFFILRNAARDLSNLDLTYWHSMIDIILERAEAAQERTGRKITNRQGYVQKAIASDLDALLSQAIATVAEESPLSAPLAPSEPKNYCPTHHRHYSGENCRQCLLDASIEETLRTNEEENAPIIDGATYRAAIRARREASSNN